jgi:long-chain acyl-CoA synthetase
MEITRLFEILSLYESKYNYKDVVFGKKENGKWHETSANEYVEKSYQVAYGLLASGLEKGDKVATIFATNRPEWNFIDMGILLAGMIHVPLYPTLSEEDHRYILEHSDSKMLFVSDPSSYKKIIPVFDQLENLKQVYTILEVEQSINWNELLKLGRENETNLKNKIDQIKQSIHTNDLATIIYTSGTTGLPKGVMLSHKNIISNAYAALSIHQFGEENKTLSFLPLCHVFERTINYHLQILGISIYYAENMGTIADNLKEIKPDLFISVPRLLESVYDKIIAKGKDLSGLKRSIFFWAIKLGNKFDYSGKKSFWYQFRLNIADKLVFSKWREALGGATKLIIIGGAALQPRLSRIFGAAKITTLEGYGLTETSPVVAANNAKTGEIRIGTVGPLLPEVQVKIAEDGEILVKGPNVMLGYYKDPENTKLAIDNEGWLHTGDIGILEDNKYLKITDRKKEIFKTSAGKYVAPQMIENKLKESFFIEQAMVVGEDEKFVSALISPNFRYLHGWCASKKIKYRDNYELVRKEEVLEQYRKEIKPINEQLGQIEQIKRIKLVCEDWTPATGELTPTLKLKRNVIYKKYDNLLKDIYNYAPEEENRADKSKRI